MKRFYHGSPTPGLTRLDPRTDVRSGVHGLFVSDEPFGPMLYALLPDRSRADISYQTEGASLIHGTVTTPLLLPEGWLYTVEVDEAAVKETPEGFLLQSPCPTTHVQRVTDEDLRRAGWTIRLTS